MRDDRLPNVSWRPPLTSSGACAALDLSPVGWAPPRTNFLAFLSNRTVVFAGDSVLTPYAAQEHELLGGLLPIFDASDLLLGAGAAHSGRHLPTGDCTHWVGCDLFNGSATNGSLDCPQFTCAAAPDFGVLARYVAPSLMAFLSDG